MNLALINGEIDFYLTGGTYTASPARLDGATNIRGITPKKGPLAGGKGGITWVEVTSVVNNPQVSPLAYDFLEYVQDPEICHAVASPRVPTIRSPRWATRRSSTSSPAKSWTPFSGTAWMKSCRTLRRLSDQSGLRRHG